MVITRCFIQGDFKSRKEAMWALCNVSVCGTDANATYIADLGAIAKMVDLLKYMVCDSVTLHKCI